MISNNVPAAADKPAFEPSELVEHGDADKLTRGTHSSANPADGDYTS